MTRPPSKPVQLAELPGRPGYTVEFEVEPEPAHHEECECEQCEAMVPAAEYRAHEEARERAEEHEREAGLPAYELPPRGWRPGP